MAAKCAAVLCGQLLAADAHAKRAGTPWLTAAGIAELRRLVRANGELSAEIAVLAALPRLPDWNAKHGELWLGGEMLVEINPASLPGVILTAFQPNGWAAGHVPNPLTPEPGEPREDAHDRLLNAIKNLNRILPAGTIHFRLIPGGTSIRWEYAPTGRARRKRKR